MTDSARPCPACGYDCAALPEPRCPECGRELPAIIWNARRTISRRAAFTAIIVLLALSVLPVLVFTSLGSTIVGIGLAWFVSLTTDPPVTPPGKLLPHPTVTYDWHGSRASRLAWNHQYAAMLRAWHEQFEQWDGTQAGLERLALATMEMRAIKDEADTYRYIDFIFSRDVWHEIKNAAPALDRAHAYDIGTWAASESQALAGNIHQEWYWTPFPLDMLSALTRSADPQIRLFVLERAALDPDPGAGELVRRLTEDPDPEVAALAERSLEWRQGLWNWDP